MKSSLTLSSKEVSPGLSCLQELTSSIEKKSTKVKQMKSKRQKVQVNESQTEEKKKSMKVKQKSLF